MDEEEITGLDDQATVTPRSSRTRERYARILSSATELFLKGGYAETSMDAILELSGGSKETLYRYFPTKADLFRAVIDAVVSNRSQPKFDVHQDVRTTLIEYCVQRLVEIFSAEHLALLRVVIGESQKFPELGQMYHERAPKHSRQLLAEYLDTLSEQRSLILDDAEEASQFLVGMLVHEWFIDCLLLGAVLPSEGAMRQRTERAVDLFLTAYQHGASDLLRHGGN